MFQLRIKFNTAKLRLCSEKGSILFAMMAHQSEHGVREFALNFAWPESW